MSVSPDSTTVAIAVRVWRGTPAGGAFEAFEVPQQSSQTILDVVTWIQRHLDASLSYRFACRVGMCGSCAMMVNGIPRWTCRTHVNKVMRDNQLTIEPLRNLPVIKDLACDMSEFFDKWKDSKGYFQGSTTRHEPVSTLSPNSAQRRVADAATECINCAICYASCDVVSWNRDYLGPAALNRAWSLQNDERDSAFRERLSAVAGDAGCHQCHSQQGCATYCPNELNPTASIAGLKRMVAQAYVRGNIDRDGRKRNA
ncbi:MAG TPA: succinate dehydrogenase/fumarate reductase iron-sulfur subunit [Gammaproteobacteria bacterium]|nr:succinate dehydrogenase/fumarate reductase iron-sulfur subunit [Gammaproteobacteria bacterium]